MQRPNRSPHWTTFATIPHVLAGAIGSSPSKWCSRHGILEVPTGSIQLPTQQLDRAHLREICLDLANPVLLGYVCVMAWGGQGAGKSARYAALAWKSRDAITDKLNALRSGSLTRCQAYNLFSGSDSLPGLGPAYFTKLLYFFSPTPDFYIMDQWTGKSLGLLTGQWVVRMTGNAVSNLNKCGNYQAYCEEVDSVADVLGVTGEQAEEMMMSKGGHRPWPWRSHVRNNWPAQAPAGRYSASTLHGIYPHIPLNCL